MEQIIRATLTHRQFQFVPTFRCVGHLERITGLFSL